MYAQRMHNGVGTSTLLLRDREIVRNILDEQDNVWRFAAMPLYTMKAKHQTEINKHCMAYQTNLLYFQSD